MAAQDYTLPIQAAIQSWGPKAYHALIICAIGIIFAFLFQFISRLVISKAGNADSKVWRYLPSKQVSSVARLLSRLIFWLTIILTLLISLEAFQIKLSSRVVDDVGRLIPKLFGAIFALMLGIFLSNVIKNIIGVWANKFSYGPLRKVSNIAYVLCMMLTVLVVTKQLGFDVGFITSFILVVVACFLLGTSISFGVGSAPSVSSLLAAFYIKKNTRIGDYIKCDGVEGVLHEVTKTSFIIRNEGSTYIIPARKMFSSIVEIKDDE
jgi:hypothetical protein